jgi:hypothetical protein
VVISHDVIHDIIDRKIKYFLKSDIEDRYKKIAYNLNILVYINNKMRKSLYGCASYEWVTLASRRKYKITDNDSRIIKFEKHQCIALLEICPKMILSGPDTPIEELKETISHELSHLIEMRINGQTSRKLNLFHGKMWQKIAKYFGCKDIDYKG